MFFPSRNIIESLKKEYPSGTRVELEYMDDPYRYIEVGTTGTVKHVDDIGTIHVAWDDGSNLGLVYGEDSCRKLKTVKTVCKGKEKIWDSREEAVSFFTRILARSEGAEREKYKKILTDLAANMDVCTDAE